MAMSAECITQQWWTNARETSMQVNLANAENDLRAEGDIATADSAEKAQFPSTAGTFALRRSYYLAETGKLLLSAGQQLALDSLVSANDPEQRQTRIAQHLSLVVNIASRYADQSMGLFDLVREGNQGLIHALERYEAQDNLPFSTFATMCICQHIELAIMNWNMRPDALPSGLACKDCDASEQCNN
jgi:DNA-directed RNA polymerase sigma subunit (sigma70/sigma32)